MQTNQSGIGIKVKKYLGLQPYDIINVQVVYTKEKSDLCPSPINVKCLLLTMKYIKGAEMSQKKRYTRSHSFQNLLLLSIFTL